MRSISPRWLKFAEIVFICACVFIISTPLRNTDPNVRLKGEEVSFLMNSGLILSNIYEETETLSFWNPYIANGEPLIEGPFSYVLNPLMMLPAHVLGFAQGGKVVMLIHVYLMALGGWVLGYVLEMRSVGRITLALLLVGNGSLVGSVAHFQMAISQCYVPWIYASLWGVLQTPKRRYLILLIGAIYLLLTAGTYWYVLPSAIACGVIALSAVIKLGESRRFTVDRPALRRLFIAGVFVFGITPIRWLPQVFLTEFMHHPLETFNHGTRSLGDLTLNLFGTDTYNVQYFLPIFYHYIMPPLALLTVIGVRLVSLRKAPISLIGWRILLPTLICIVIFSVWSQQDTPIIHWLYDQVELLRQWRILPRMLVIVTPFIALLFSWLVDDIIQVVRHMDVVPVVRFAVMTAVVFSTIYAVWDVSQNWRRINAIEPDISYTEAPLADLLMLVGEELVPIETVQFFDYIPYYDAFVRVATGNPDSRFIGVEPTLGTYEMMDYMAEFGLVTRTDGADILEMQGYNFIPEIQAEFPNVVWHNPLSPSYAFLVERDILLDDERLTPLIFNETTTVFTYDHRVNAIDVTLSEYPEDSVLVLREVNLPGWSVMINDEPAQLESVGGYIGVQLTDDIPVRVRFSYTSRWFGFGAGISLVSVLLLLGWLIWGESYRRRDHS